MSKNARNFTSVGPKIDPQESFKKIISNQNSEMHK